MAENIDGTPTGTGIFNTKIPEYSDAADIQAALRLYHYGSYTYDGSNTDTANLVSPSIAKHLQTLADRVTAQEELGTGSEYSSTLPTSPSEGFVWMDAESNVTSTANYAAAVYSPDAPTTDLVDGLIWVDKNANPPRGYVYDAGTEEWVSITEIPGIVDAAGDLIIGAGADDIDKLSIGSEGEVLKVVSGLPAWSSERDWVLKGSGSLSGAGFSVSGLNGDRLFIVLKDFQNINGMTGAGLLVVRFNNDSGPNYVNVGGLTSAGSLHSQYFSTQGSYDVTIAVDLANSAAALKPVSTISAYSSDGITDLGYYKNTNAISSIQVTMGEMAEFNGGTYQVWSYE